VRRIKAKFAHIWSKPIRRTNELAPFPGTAQLRWVILTSRNVAKYEGKPSSQAFKLVMSLAKMHLQPFKMIEFDKHGPIVNLWFRNDGNWGTNGGNWEIWKDYHFGGVGVMNYYKEWMRKDRNVEAVP
jgi:hypothetical protein